MELAGYDGDISSSENIDRAHTLCSLCDSQHDISTSRGKVILLRCSETKEVSPRDSESFGSEDEIEDDAHLENEIASKQSEQFSYIHSEDLRQSVEEASRTAIRNQQILNELSMDVKTLNARIRQQEDITKALDTIRIDLASTNRKLCTIAANMASISERGPPLESVSLLSMVIGAVVFFCGVWVSFPARR